MTRHRQWHISGWPAILLAPLAIPVGLLVMLAVRLFGLKDSADLTAADVASYLDDALGGRGGAWDWDDFTSISITDPALEAIRDEAARVRLPLTEEGRGTLEALLERTRKIERGAGPSVS